MLARVFSNNLYFCLILILIVMTNFTKSDDLVVEIDNPKFSEKGLNDKVYEIKAKKGFKSESELDLYIVEGKFKTNKDGKWIYLEAEEGNFSQVNNFIELKKNIIFYTDDGERLKSSKATFDMENDVIHLKENVRHESIEGIIFADSSLITNNFNNITYTGNVLSIFKDAN